MISIINAIRAINNDALVSIIDNDVDQITWKDGTPEISKRIF